MFILKIPQYKFYFLTVKYERNNLNERKKDVRSKISRNNNNSSQRQEQSALVISNADAVRE